VPSKETFSLDCFLKAITGEKLYRLLKEGKKGELDTINGRECLEESRQIELKR
jgi:hypothetical protein